MQLRQFLVAVGAVMLLVANIVAAKIIPISIPFFGTVQASAGVFPIAVVYLCTDIINERYGRAAASRAVWTMVTCLLVGWGVVQLTVILPRVGGVAQSSYKTVLAASIPLVLSSLVTTVLFQLFDVYLFDVVRSLTSDSQRWVRNVVSTSLSQCLDTTVFTVLAFAVFPSLIGGLTLSTPVIISVIFVEYAVKLLIAVIDTPIFWLLTQDDEIFSMEGVTDV